jgi:hypothetical protein
MSHPERTVASPLRDAPWPSTGVKNVALDYAASGARLVSPAPVIGILYPFLSASPTVRSGEFAPSGVLWA